MELLAILAVNVISIFTAYILGKYNQPEQSIRHTLNTITRLYKPTVSFISPTGLQAKRAIEATITNE